MAMANDLITIEEAEEIVRMADKNGDGVIDYNGMLFYFNWKLPEALSEKLLLLWVIFENSTYCCRTQS